MKNQENTALDILWEQSTLNSQVIILPFSSPCRFFYFFIFIAHCWTLYLTMDDASYTKYVLMFTDIWYELQIRRRMLWNQYSCIVFSHYTKLCSFQNLRYKLSLYTNQGTHQAGPYSGFYSNKQLGVLKVASHLYTWVESATVKVKCLA